MCDARPGQPDEPIQSDTAVSLSGRRAWFAAIAAVVRTVPLCCTGTPRTPLRALCIAAFDFSHRLRTAHRLPPHTRQRLARFLDYAAELNARLDAKHSSPTGPHWSSDRGDSSETRRLIAEFVRGWRTLEQQRPDPRVAPCAFDPLRRYREAVLRHALGAAAALTFHLPTVAAGQELMHHEPALEQAFRLAMLCQVIDDVLDRTADARRGLPSFLTTTETGPPHQQAQLVAEHYAAPSAATPFVRRGPLGAALFALSLTARCILWVWSLAPHRGTGIPAATPRQPAASLPTGR